jgi:hypothetical protein
MVRSHSGGSRPRNPAPAACRSFADGGFGTATDAEHTAERHRTAEALHHVVRGGAGLLEIACAKASLKT